MSSKYFSEVTLVAEKSFTMRLPDGREFPGMRIVQRMDNVAKLQNSAGHTILVLLPKDSYSQSFQELFSALFDDDDKKGMDVVILQMSDDLWRQLYSAGQP